MSLLRRPPLARRSHQNVYLLHRAQCPAPWNTRTPDPLLSLISGAHGDSKEFHANIREYDALMSFASVGGDLDIEMIRRPGCYVYRIHGPIYHRIGSVAGNAGALPKFGKIYLFDTEAATDVMMYSAGGRLGRQPSPPYMT